MQERNECEERKKLTNEFGERFVPRSTIFKFLEFEEMWDVLRFWFEPWFGLVDDFNWVLLLLLLLWEFRIFSTFFKFFFSVVRSLFVFSFVFNCESEFEEFWVSKIFLSSLIEFCLFMLETLLLFSHWVLFSLSMAMILLKSAETSLESAVPSVSGSAFEECSVVKSRLSCFILFPSSMEVFLCNNEETFFCSWGRIWIFSCRRFAERNHSFQKRKSEQNQQNN